MRMEWNRRSTFPRELVTRMCLVCMHDSRTSTNTQYKSYKTQHIKKDRKILKCCDCPLSSLKVPTPIWSIMEINPDVRGTHPIFIKQKLRCLQGNRAYPPVLIYTYTRCFNTRIKWIDIASWFYTRIRVHVFEEHWWQKYRLRYTHMHTHLCWHADYSRPYIECVIMFENICKSTLSSSCLGPLSILAHTGLIVPQKI